MDRMRKGDVGGTGKARVPQRERGASRMWGNAGCSRDTDFLRPNHLII